MNLSTLIDKLGEADASQMRIILIEDQSRGSAAAYDISDVQVMNVEDEDGDYELETCADCDGEGVVENDDEDDEDGEKTCPECDGTGEIETGENVKTPALVIWLEHTGYAPAMEG